MKMGKTRIYTFLVYNIYEMNRPSPDDMNDIIMAEQRAKIKKLEKENKELKAYKSLYVLLKERRDRQIEIEKRLRLGKNKKKENIIILIFILVMILLQSFVLVYNITTDGI